jgi:hypothetical protein
MAFSWNGRMEMGMGLLTQVLYALQEVSERVSQYLYDLERCQLAWFVLFLFLFLVFGFLADILGT